MVFETVFNFKLSLLLTLIFSNEIMYATVGPIQSFFFSGYACLIYLNNELVKLKINFFSLENVPQRK